MTLIEAGYCMVGKGETVVLIHGSMNSKGQWRSLADALKEKFTVIATDLTGYGATPFPEDPDTHSMLDEVDLIRRTISSLVGENTPAHLVAHSYGGAVALCYASYYPDEVLSLSLYEPMPNHLLLHGDYSGFLAEGRRLINVISDQVAQGQARTGARTFIDYFSGNGVFSMLPEKAQSTLATYVSKMLIDYRTTIETPLTLEDYRGITCPICIITGKASTGVSLSVARKLRQTIESIKWIEIQGNHMAPIANPQAVNPVVTGWLERVARQRPLN